MAALPEALAALPALIGPSLCVDPLVDFETGFGTKTFPARVAFILSPLPRCLRLGWDNLAGIFASDGYIPLFFGCSHFPLPLSF